LVTSNVPWLRGGKIDFFAPVDGWTADDYILDFWSIAQAYVVNKYGHLTRDRNQFNIDDLQGVANEALVNFARDDFFPWCEENNKIATDKRLFWSLAKRQLNWRVNDYLEAHTDQHDSTQDLEELPSLSWMRTNFNRHVDASTLHVQLVDKLETLPTADQAILALYHFEGQTVYEIAKSMGLSVSTTQRYLRMANTNVLVAGIYLAAHIPEGTTAPVPLGSETTLTRWVHTTYQADVDSYLKYVAIHYRADVRYLVDMLNAANGIRTRNGFTGGAAHAVKAKFTEDQVREIRTRLEHGEKRRALAAAYNVNYGTISAIEHRTSYAYVKDAA
jgi:RNA polymerase sigma factor (sigma-70 family)